MYSKFGNRRIFVVFCAKLRTKLRFPTKKCRDKALPYLATNRYDKQIRQIKR